MILEEPRVIDDTIKLSDKLSFLDKSKTFEKSQLSIELIRDCS